LKIRTGNPPKHESPDTYKTEIMLLKDYIRWGLLVCKLLKNCFQSPGTRADWAYPTDY